VSEFYPALKSGENHSEAMNDEYCIIWVQFHTCIAPYPETYLFRFWPFMQAEHCGEPVSCLTINVGWNIEFTAIFYAPLWGEKVHHWGLMTTFQKTVDKLNAWMWDYTELFSWHFGDVMFFSQQQRYLWIVAISWHLPFGENSCFSFFFLSFFLWTDECGF